MSESSFWNKEFKEDPEHADVPDQILDAEVDVLRPGTALDLGCGSGRNALKLSQKGWRVLGVDFAEHAIALAKQAAATAGVDAAFVVADSTKWAPDTEFDLVFSTYALPGREANRRVLTTAAHALAPGGILIVVEWDRSMAQVWHFEEDELTTPDEIVSMLPMELAIETSEVRRLELFVEKDPRAYAGSAANVAFVRARRVSPQRRP